MIEKFKKKKKVKGGLQSIYAHRKFKTLGTQVVFLMQIQCLSMGRKRVREMNGYEITEGNLDFWDYLRYQNDEILSWDKILISGELEDQHVCPGIYSFDQEGFKWKIEVVR